MSNNNNSSFDSMKYEVAREVGVPLKQCYNGDITAREAGKIGGTIVQKVFEQYKNAHGDASNMNQ